MPWILIAAAFAALLLAFKTASVGWLMVLLLVSFLLAMTGLLQLLAQRVASRSRDAGMMIDPVALEQLRQQAAKAGHDNAATDPN